MMRKKIISMDKQQQGLSESDWLNLEAIATVEVSSEDPGFPVESALLAGHETGWRAAGPGKQTVRLVFDEPLQLRHISLQFEEHEIQRTQEYVLSWSADDGDSLQEILRQQWNFSPSGSTTEELGLDVNLEQVTQLELTIIPDISGGAALASLARLRLA